MLCVLWVYAGLDGKGRPLVDLVCWEDGIWLRGLRWMGVSLGLNGGGFVGIRGIGHDGLRRDGMVCMKH